MVYRMQPQNVIDEAAGRLHAAADEMHPNWRTNSQARDDLIFNLCGFLSVLLVLRAEQTFDTGFMRFATAMLEANARTLAKQRGVIIE